MNAARVRRSDLAFVLAGNGACSILNSVAQDSVRLATWNCFGAPPTVDDFFAQRPFWPERLEVREVAEALAPFDVVCVQENLVDRVRESLERLQRSAGFEHLWFDPMGPGADGSTFVGGGLAILSRLPMAVTFRQLPRGAGPDGFARKGFATAKITLPSGRALHLVSTHLQADDFNVPLEVSRATRAAQLDEILRAVAALDAGVPAVLCGDLNVPHGTDEYDELSRALGDAWVDAPGRAGLVTYDCEANDIARTFHGGGPERMLVDYVFARGPHVEATDVRALLASPLVDVGGRPASYAKRAFASDHAGVGVTLTLH